MYRVLYVWLAALYCNLLPIVSVICPSDQYYDTITDNCHSCRDCISVSSPTHSCKEVCLPAGRSTTVSVANGSATGGNSAASVERILIFVFPTVLGAIVLILVILAVLHFTGCLAKLLKVHHENAGTEKTTHLTSPTEDSGNIGPTITAASSRPIHQQLYQTSSFPYQAIAATSEEAANRQLESASGRSRYSESQGHISSSNQTRHSSYARSMSHNPAMISLAEDTGYVRSIAANVERPYHSESLKGNPVCQPEQSDASFSLAPTVTGSSATMGLYLSLDCCKVTYSPGEDSGMRSHGLFEMETFSKEY